MCVGVGVFKTILLTYHFVSLTVQMNLFFSIIYSNVLCSCLQ